MQSGESISRQKKQDKSASSSASASQSRPNPENRTLETLTEYMGSDAGLKRTAISTSGGDERLDRDPDRSPGSKERLLQEWEIEDSAEAGPPSEEDLLKRMEILETRLDAFETTCYTFLLYAKQLTDRTVSFFEDIFGLGQDDLAQIHDRLGVNYNNKGDYEKAVEAFKKLVEINRTPASCFKLGVASDNNGDFQGAIEALRTAISMDKEYLKAYYKLAEVYARVENFGEAIRFLTQATEIDPKNDETQYRLGNVHSARGSYDQAIAAFNKVLKSNPSFPGIYQSLGIAYEQKGDQPKALEFFKKSI